MKTILTKSITTIFLIIVVCSCNTKKSSKDRTPKDTLEVKSGKIKPNEVKGGKYPDVKPNFKEPLNEEEKPYIVPNGPKRGKVKPNNKVYKIKELKKNGPNGDNAGTQEPLFFKEITSIDNATPRANPVLPEPSVAENGQIVMTTGNNWMSLSKDGGNTFTSVNPTTIFPENYGGFCCDQVLQYVPEYDLFVWLLQYRKDANGVNMIRIAAQSTENVKNSNGTAWTYWDFPRTIFGTSGIIDYNDMSFGNTFLYWSSSVGGGQNRFVIRVPLKELKAKSTINFQYTGSTEAFWSHVTQNGVNGVYWAGHKNNSTMKIYSFMDSDGFYSWRDVNINSWPNSTISSTAANGTDWLSDASWKTYVRAAAVRGNSAFFAWNASKGGGFPQPHIQIAEINLNTFTLVNQMQVWNPDFAFAYPYFEMNSRQERGQLGMIVAFGGTPFNASSGVGVWGDFVVYYPRLSGLSQNNYGHYHTARRSGSDPSQWVGAGYTYEANGTVLPYYLRFSR